MGHSADYQTDLQITQLERIARLLSAQGEKLSGAGFTDLAGTAFEQAELLTRAIVDLKSLMEVQ